MPHFKLIIRFRNGKNSLKQKMILIVIYCMLLLPNLTVAQYYGNCPDELVPKYDSKKRMWGFSDLLGQWQIRPFYVKVSPFHQNLAVVQKGNLSGVIDCQGNVVVPYQYDAITSFQNGRAWVRKDGLWGMTDNKGRLWLSPQFEEIAPITPTELIWVRKNGLWGLYNEDKKFFVCPPKYPVAKALSHNASMVGVDQKHFGVLNHVNCSFLIEPKITAVKKVNSALVIYELGGKWGVFSYDGRIKANPEYDSLYLGAPNLFVVGKNGKYGLMDLEGRILLPIEYDQFAEYSEGLFPVRKQNLWGYANLLGKLYIKPEFEEAGIFSGKQAIVKKKGLKGVISISKKMVLPVKYAEVIASGHRPFYAAKLPGAGFFLVNREGEKILPVEFDTIYLEDTASIIRVRKQRKIGFLDLSNPSLTFPEFEDVEAFENGFALVGENHKWGIVDAEGQILVPVQFDSIRSEMLSNRLVFKVWQNGLCGLFDKQGKQVTPVEYEMLIPAGTGLLKARKQGKYGVMKTNGSVLAAFIYDSMTNTCRDSLIPEWPAIVSLDNKFTLLDEKKGEVVPLKTERIYYLGEGYYAQKNKKNYCLIDGYGNAYPKVKFDSLGNCSLGKIAAFNGKKWGYVNKEGKTEIDFDYQEAGRFLDGIAVVKMNDKYGVIGVSGKTISAFQYDRYIQKPEGRFLEKGGKSWFINSNGEIKERL